MPVANSTGRTYQATDLANTKRRDFIDDARRGIARLRTTDGETLVAMPERDLSALAGLRGHALAFLSLETAMSRPREDRRATDFGELAWANILDEADLREFRAEFVDSLATALTERRPERVEELVRAWRLTSDLLRDEEAMARVNTPTADDVELPSPSENTATSAG